VCVCPEVLTICFRVNPFASGKLVPVRDESVLGAVQGKAGEVTLGLCSPHVLDVGVAFFQEHLGELPELLLRLSCADLQTGQHVVRGL